MNKFQQTTLAVVLLGLAGGSSAKPVSWLEVLKSPVVREGAITSATVVLSNALYKYFKKNTKYAVEEKPVLYQLYLLLSHLKTNKAISTYLRTKLFFVEQGIFWYILCVLSPGKDKLSTSLTRVLFLKLVTSMSFSEAVIRYISSKLRRFYTELDECGICHGESAEIPLAYCIKNKHKFHTSCFLNFGILAPCPICDGPVMRRLLWELINKPKLTDYGIGFIGAASFFLGVKAADYFLLKKFSVELRV